MEPGLWTLEETVDGIDVGLCQSYNGLTLDPRVYGSRFLVY